VESAPVILLDTHAIVWLVMEPRKLSKEAASAIRRKAARGGLAVASITLWELAMLVAQGKIRGAGTVAASVRAIVEGAAVTVMEVTPDVAAQAVQLPDSVAADPADRLIVATAMAHSMPLVTRDSRIRESGVCRTIW
jgi:PIN domain nuclease of toxin-antitoxin system